MSIRAEAAVATPQQPPSVALRSDALGMAPGVRPPRPVATATAAPVATVSANTATARATLSPRATMPVLCETEGKSGFFGKKSDGKSLMERASDMKKDAKEKLDKAKGGVKKKYDEKMLSHCPGYKKRFQHYSVATELGDNGILIFVSADRKKPESEEELWSGDMRISKYKNEAVRQAKSLMYEIDGRQIEGHHPRCMGMMMAETPKEGEKTLSASDKAKIIKLIGNSKFSMPGKGGLVPAHAMLVLPTPAESVDSIILGDSAVADSARTPAEMQEEFHGVAYPLHIIMGEKKSDGDDDKKPDDLAMGHRFYFSRFPKNNLSTMVLVKEPDGKKNLHEAFAAGSDGVHLNVRLAWHARKVNRMLVCAAKYGPKEAEVISQVLLGKLEDIEV